MRKKIIGISLGDPAGIGPEICVKGYPYIEKIPSAIPLVIGDLPVIEQNLEALEFQKFRCGLGGVRGKQSGFHRGITGSGSDRQRGASPYESNPDRDYLVYSSIPSNLNIVKTREEIKDKFFNLYNTGVIKSKNFPVGKDSALCGKASFTYVERAIQLWKEGVIDALVTLPISKKAWNLANFNYSGHTELLVERFNCKRYAMVMVAGNIRVLLVTTHIPLKDVSKKLSVFLLIEKIITGYEFLKRTGILSPVIGVSAVNPHSGEGGLLGKEEIEIIVPAIRKLRKEGIDCKGPFPADAIFKMALEGKFDMIIAMYHDQAMIPLKTFYFDKLVNCTAGIDMVRTSPGHGTAFDIAYKGVAQVSPFVEAYKMAVQLTSNTP